MKKNMGNTDRIIRIAAALIMLVLVFAIPVASPLSWILLTAGTIFILTSVAGNCPLYSLLGVSSCKKKTV